MVDLDQHLKEFGMKNCPIDNSLKIIGKKFTMHILRNILLLKQQKFNEFLRSIEGINTKTLSLRLREMVSEGLIKRKIIDERPLRVEYSLTEKGKSLNFFCFNKSMFRIICMVNFFPIIFKLLSIGQFFIPNSFKCCFSSTILFTRHTSNQYIIVTYLHQV